MSGWAGGRRQLTTPLSAGSGIGRQSPAAVAQAAVAVVLLGAVLGSNVANLQQL